MFFLPILISIITQVYAEDYCAVPPSPVINKIEDCTKHLDLVEPSYYSPNNPCYYIYINAVNKKDNCEVSFLSKQAISNQSNAVINPTPTSTIFVSTPTSTPTVFINKQKLKLTSTPTPTPTNTPTITPTVSPEENDSSDFNNLKNDFSSRLAIFISGVVVTLIVILIGFLGFKTFRVLKSKNNK